MFLNASDALLFDGAASAERERVEKLASFQEAALRHALRCECPLDFLKASSSRFLSEIGKKFLNFLGVKGPRVWIAVNGDLC